MNPKTLSDFILRACEQDSGLEARLQKAGDANRYKQFEPMLTQAVSKCQDDVQFKKAVRGFRQFEMQRIAWRDLSGTASLDETLQDLSALADACIRVALSVLSGWHAPDVPPMLVLGLGKLGGGELNFSSDIDLIFTHNATAEDEVAYTQVARAFIAALNDVTAEGFVFRVDMRLRPHGNSGPLVPSLAHLENYYQQNGRDWERYALQKARVITGSESDVVLLQSLIQDFVYRPYVDFAMRDAIRVMKSKIAVEVKKKRMEHNVKLGAGGIREIEFIVQSYQLIYGGRYAELQQTQLLSVLMALVQHELMAQDMSDELAAHYRFLRTVENRIQMQQDRQTHDLPPYEHGQDQLTQAMGEPSWDALCSKIQAVRDGVAHYFETAVASEVPAEDDMPEPELKPSNELDTYIQKWAQQDLTDEARDRLDKILPQLQAAVAAQTVVSLEAALEWIDTVVTRSAYLVLLLENAGVIQCVLEVFALSELFKVQIMQHPVLLEAFTAEHFGQPQSKADMAEALSTAMASIDVDDIEQHMETLRYFKLRMHLNIAVADVRGELPIMNVSDHLTWLAEVIVAEVECISFAAMAKRYGYPEHCDENQHGFAVIAYGKLGGIELSYRSDLDVVFLYAQAKGDTQGEKSLHHGQFYARVGQRMLHIMQTPTHLGMLYEPDMRLRPSGSAGLLVSSFEAFEDYQANKAWTWEHQSLVRARGVCGDAAVIKQFENLRMKQLGLKRECAAVAKDVVGMRDKMRANQKLKRAFDIKKSTGGLVDIEFMVQFLVLAHAHDHKGLMTYTDNIRILEAAAGVQLVHAKTAKNIIAIYQEYRYALHQRMLTRMDMRDYAAEFAPSREVVANLWSKLFEASVS